MANKEVPIPESESTHPVIEIVPPASEEAAQPVPLDPKTAQVLMRIYMTKRINYQSEWYKNRNLENDYNASFTLRWAALIMAVSTVAASSSFFATDPETSAWLSTLTALLPPLAALIAAFRELYQWERQSNVYQDTILGLEEAKLILPDEYITDSTSPSAEKQDASTEAEATPETYQIYARLVKEAEAVFEKEANQWGQITLEKTDDTDIFNKNYQQTTDQIAAFQAKPGDAADSNKPSA